MSFSSGCVWAYVCVRERAFACMYESRDRDKEWEYMLLCNLWYVVVHLSACLQHSIPDTSATDDKRNGITDIVFLLLIAPKITLLQTKKAEGNVHTLVPKSTTKNKKYSPENKSILIHLFNFILLFMCFPLYLCALFVLVKHLGS